MSESTIWFRLMLVSFAANGLGPFGLKILTERGLAAYQSQYLMFWYLAGFVFALVALLMGRAGVNWREVALGAAMGGSSLAGQTFTVLALANDLPGHIAFPLTTGGSLLLVATTGILLFKERIGPYGLCGVILGIMSLVMLSVG